MPFELLKIRHQGPTRGNPTSGVVKSPPSKLLKVRKIVADVSSISTKLDTGYRIKMGTIMFSTLGQRFHPTIQFTVEILITERGYFPRYSSVQRREIPKRIYPGVRFWKHPKLSGQAYFMIFYVSGKRRRFRAGYLEMIVNDQV